MKTLLYILSFFALVLGSCKKTEFNDMSAKGEGLVGFTLKSPGTGTKLSLNAATPNSTITFSWNESKPGLHTLPTYTLVAVRRTNEAANFDTPLIQFDAGSNTSLTLTTKQIDDALKAKGVADGALSELLWSVKATNGDVTIVAQNQFFIDITRMKDGASPFFLLGPASSSAATVIDPTLATSNLVFNWTKSQPASGGSGVTYKVLFAPRKIDVNGNVLPTDWANPLFSLKSNNNGADSLATVSYKSISDSLTKHGYTSFSDIDSLRWTVVATSGTWNQYSDYINDIAIQRQVVTYLYLPGDYQGWSPGSAPKLASTDGINFEGYIWVPAGGTGEFKINVAPDWDHANYGGTSGATGGVLDAGGPNLKWPTTGTYYLVKVDMSTKTWTVAKTDWKVIGSGTPGGWDSATPMTYDASTGKWKVTLTTSAGEFKFRANDNWDLSLGSGSGGYLTANNGGNLPITAGTKTIILDLSNPLKYTYIVQ